MYQSYKFNQQPRCINYNASADSAYLYEPLKNALKKYGDHHYHHYSSHIDNNLLKHSKVANNNRSLSPSQAQNIKASIIFPHNKTLVPTNHIQKVQGKVFVPLVANERTKQPLSYNQFLRVKTEGFEQIVYEIQEQDEINVYTYTTNMSRRTLPQQNEESSLRKVYDLKTKQETNENLASHYSKAEVRYWPNVDYHAYCPEQQLDKSGKVCVLARQMPSFVQTLPRKYSYSINEQQNELIIEPNQVKPYTFSKQTLRTYNKSSLNAKNTSNKLNLFNIFDQCGNNGFSSQSCGSNQICASRVSRSNWK